jgi:hypothetical protein
MKFILLNGYCLYHKNMLFNNYLAKKINVAYANFSHIQIFWAHLLIAMFFVWKFK